MDYKFEIMALIAAITAIISLVTLVRKSKEKKREEAEKNKSDISTYIYIAGPGHRLGIINNGNVPVTDLNLSIEPLDGQSSPLIPSELENTLPVKRLAPGDEINLIMALSSDTGSTFTIPLTWKTEDGKTHSKESLKSI